MIYVVALQNGLRGSDGVANYGFNTRRAAEDWIVKHKRELNEKHPLPADLQERFDAEWTYVVVDEEGLAALPFSPDAYRPDRTLVDPSKLEIKTDTCPQCGGPSKGLWENVGPEKLTMCHQCHKAFVNA